MAAVNLNHVTHFSWGDATLSTVYFFQKKKTFLGFTTRRESVYMKGAFGEKLFHQETIPEDYFLKDGLIYSCPELEIHLVNKKVLYKYFLTFNELIQHKDALLEKHNEFWIQ